MRITEHTLDTTDGPMGLYDAAPDGEAGRAVIVIQEAFGVNRHIQDVTRRFADLGYRAASPVIFHRAGSGSIDDYDNVDRAEMMKLFEGLDDDGILTDVDAARSFLHGQGFADSAIGIVGFCFGGRVTFLVATNRALGAAVTFYGGGIAAAHAVFEGMPKLTGGIPSMATPWLGLFGDLDHGIPPEQVEALRTAMGAAPVAWEIVRYAEAGHGFHCDVRADYHEASAKDGWTRTLDWFDRHLG
jgi:carboxymethylenebutenolidase